MKEAEVPDIWEIEEDVRNSLQMKGLVRVKARWKKQNVSGCLDCLEVAGKKTGEVVWTEL